MHSKSCLSAKHARVAGYGNDVFLAFNSITSCQPSLLQSQRLLTPIEAGINLLIAPNEDLVDVGQ
jgi:hypothetical protein